MAEITGRKVAVFVVGAFGIIVAVNLLMAYKAISTFPGVEVANSYVASQDFDARREAQEALGWDLTSDYDASAGQLRLVFTGADGRPAPVGALSVLVGRATEASEDSRPAFVWTGADWQAPLTLAPGKWLLRVEALSEDGTLFEQRLNITIRG